MGLTGFVYGSHRVYGLQQTFGCCSLGIREVADIRTFQILRKATNSAECCLFRRFFQISAGFLFWRTVLNTRPRRFDQIFAKGQAASTIFRREYAARGLGARAKASKSRAGGGEAGWCDGSRRAGELTPGSTRVKKPKSWRSACAL